MILPEPSNSGCTLDSVFLESLFTWSWAYLSSFCYYVGPPIFCNPCLPDFWSMLLFWWTTSSSSFLRKGVMKENFLKPYPKPSLFCLTPDWQFDYQIGNQFSSEFWKHYSILCWHLRNFAIKKPDAIWW